MSTHDTIHRHEFGPDTESNVATDFSGQRAFFKRLERELIAAKRAGYEYLTVYGPGKDDFYFGLVTVAEFIPHNEEGKYNDRISRYEVVTYPVGDLQQW